MHTWVDETSVEDFEHVYTQKHAQPCDPDEWLLYYSHTSGSEHNSAFGHVFPAHSAHDFRVGWNQIKLENKKPWGVEPRWKSGCMCVHVWSSFGCQLIGSPLPRNGYRIGNLRNLAFARCKRGVRAHVYLKGAGSTHIQVSTRVHALSHSREWGWSAELNQSESFWQLRSGSELNPMAGTPVNVQS